MYRVVILEPTFKTCGGNHRTEDVPAEKYATFPTAILITQRDPKEFRMVKRKNKSFFTQFSLNPKDYCAADYEYNFETLEEAREKLMYEAYGRGDYIRTQCGFWILAA
jgi:hypothetical protein